MILALRTFDRFDSRRYPLLVLSSILGGGMSSRLFQEVRERRGLAYSVFSYSQSYLDAGYLGIKAGLDTKRLTQALEVIMEELRRVLNEEIPEKEVAKAIIKDKNINFAAIGPIKDRQKIAKLLQF